LFEIEGIILVKLFLQSFKEYINVMPAPIAFGAGITKYIFSEAV